MRFNFRKTIMTLAVALGATALPAQKVHTIGDSTMAEYDEDATVTRGWGMYLQQFLEGLEVNNRGKGGADSRGFYESDAHWGSVKKQMKAGDYVLIQFAHNDEKNGGMDGHELKAYYEGIGDAAGAAAVDERGTVPSTTYKEHLHKYIGETRAMGCTPILVGPVCRSYFSGSTIRRNGRHDLGDGFSVLTSNGPTTGHKVGVDDHTMDYAWQMRLVAEEAGVPFVDLTTATKELYESYGDAKCHELLFDGAGSTHFNTTGATLVARRCAELLQEQGLLEGHIRLTSDVSVSPAEADFGEAYKGQTLTKEFSLSGFSLTPESGTVTIAATEGITLSVDKETWQPQLSVSYNASTLIQTFYAKVELDGEGTMEGTITVTAGDKTITIPAKASAVVLEGGVEVNAYWRLEKDDSYTLTGPAEVIPESWTGMYVQRYANPNGSTVWPEDTGFDSSRKTQRNLIEGDVWPKGDIDENPNRYIQFGIRPAAGTTLKIDRISMYVCGAGGNGMMCHVNYSAEPNFANQHTFFAPSSMVSNTMYEASCTPVLSLDEGQELLVRVYPWYNNGASGKTICISDVTIHGYAMNGGGGDSDGIKRIAADGADTVRTTYYNMSGVRTQETAKGLGIVRRELADGRVMTCKTVR